MLLERALDAGVPAAWVTADEAYGGDPKLRSWLEQRSMPYVLAVKRTELLVDVDGERIAAEQLADQVPAERWLRVSAGQGAKGRRWYDWTQLALQPASATTGRWLLVRRALDDGELAFYACAGPAGTPLATLVRVAGSRWTVEEGFQAAKGQVGLDHYEVRRWAGWQRHTILALLAHAFLVVTRASAQTASQQAKGGAAA